jgi:hypothetical protein
MKILTQEDGTVIETKESFKSMQLFYTRFGLDIILESEETRLDNDNIDKLIDFCQKSKKLFEKKETLGNR